ncbi:uncharacterized protein SPSK_02696 [Sporothrix schenckii 1099-18]|uniref:Protein kinase domain-containing protein n=2 Tax=Sporothrix schenckii TaxID=29908 RepID=U7PRK2_SPOS1|nr:uncharacterized protein SPSK_02696 [Sporothrix schenckii 1099-18]ERS97095.1 hypothetical protein HMPREF1624_06424 [Sporothrix schenckii ATCC 58251]KJR86301.1 hypothetical protein SPSK_02696 [Sporothrix schenckii 1099-18]
METVKAWEAFKTIDGRFRFFCMEGIVRMSDGQLVSARWKTRTPKPHGDDTSALHDVRPLEIHDRGPVMRPEWTRFSVARGGFDDSLFYIKKPTLLDYTDSNLSERIAREIAVYEHLRDHPHPHLATYYGCCVSANGHVDGLCLQRYRVSLQELCNPGRLNKKMFVAQGDQRSTGTAPDHVQLHPGHLDGLLAGIRHLHHLGLVHNDINPANIMVDYEGVADGTVKLVLVDFDSCRPTGTSLHESRAGRTHGWHDSDVVTAEEDSDLHALSEVRVWLFGDVTELKWDWA